MCVLWLEEWVGAAAANSLGGKVEGLVERRAERGRVHHRNLVEHVLERRVAEGHLPVVEPDIKRRALRCGVGVCVCEGEKASAAGVGGRHKLDSGGTQGLQRARAWALAAWQ